MKTQTAQVVVSTQRYHGQDRFYPKPVDWGSERYYAGAEARQALCGAASYRLRDPAAPTGWQMESLLLKAAGVSPATDSEAAQRSKIAAWWAANGARLDCDLLGRLETSFLQLTISGDFDGYRIVDRIILRYGLPLNDVSLADGRTLLDSVADKIGEAPAGTSIGPSLTRIYGTLRRFGAKHRKELEAEGVIPPPAVLMQRRIAEYRAAADRGDVREMTRLVSVYTSGVHAPVDLAAAEAWLNKAEARALALRDGDTLRYIGESYLAPHNGARPPFAGKRDRAVRILTAAVNGDFGSGRFADMNRDSARYYLGYAYYWGVGATVDKARALELFKPLTSTANAQIWAAEILLAQNRREEALRHLRNVAFSSQGGSPFRGTSVSEWLKAQPEGVCGMNSVGLKTC